MMGVVHGLVMNQRMVHIAMSQGGGGGGGGMGGVHNYNEKPWS